jgi:hypothetical protein
VAGGRSSFTVAAYENVEGTDFIIHLVWRTLLNLWSSQAPAGADAVAQ